MKEFVLPDGDAEPIEGFPGYLVTIDGHVWSERRQGSRGHWVNQQIHPRSNLRRVQLRQDGRPCNLFVHRLVLLTYIGPCPPGMECRHLDGDPSNNQVTNLKWGTHAENMEDRERHGTVPDNRGERNPKAILNEAKVRGIRSRSAEPRAALAREFGVTKECIAGVLSRKSWRHVN